MESGPTDGGGVLGPLKSFKSVTVKQSYDIDLARYDSQYEPISAVREQKPGRNKSRGACATQLE